MIEKFIHEYAWLSNYYEPCPITSNGVTFNSVEAAYQAHKFLASPDETLTVHRSFALLRPHEAKKKGQLLPLRSDWNDVKLSVMEDLLRMKFTQEFFMYRLMRTGDQELCEGNWWHDNFWGSCICSKCGNRGLNHLGKMLMKIRLELWQQSLPCSDAAAMETLSEKGDKCEHPFT